MNVRVTYSVAVDERRHFHSSCQTVYAFGSSSLHLDQASTSDLAASLERRRRMRAKWLELHVACPIDSLV
jgi:hypothetical protein